MSADNFFLVLDWILIGVNVWSLIQNHRIHKTWCRRMDAANRCVMAANAARLEAFRLLGIMLNAPGDTDVYRFALVRMMDDDAVADRTKDAIARHLKDLGIHVEPTQAAG